MNERIMSCKYLIILITDNEKHYFKSTLRLLPEICLFLSVFIGQCGYTRGTRVLVLPYVAMLPFGLTRLFQVQTSCR